MAICCLFHSSKHMLNARQDVKTFKKKWSELYNKINNGYNVDLFQDFEIKIKLYESVLLNHFDQ